MFFSALCDFFRNLLEKVLLFEGEHTPTIDTIGDTADGAEEGEIEEEGTEEEGVEEGEVGEGDAIEITTRYQSSWI